MSRMTHLANRLSTFAPGTETVVLQSRQATGNQTTLINYTVPRARHRKLTKAEELDRSLDMVLAKRTRVFEMWVDILNANGIPAPKVSDQIVDSAGETWVVTSPVMLNLNKQLYQCSTMHQAP